MHSQKQEGFAHMAILVPVILIVVLGAVLWRVITTQQEKDKAQMQAQQEAAQTSVPILSTEEQEALKAADGDIPPTPEQAPTVATTQSNPPKPVNNSTTGAVSVPKPTSTPQPSTTTPTPTIQRPTAEFCTQKNGASFTNVWFTGNSTYTYDGYAWEGGYSYSLPRVSKTETGTPLFNYDTMQTFDVVAYGTQPQWAICSKPGYVMVYYTVPNSPYTFNALAEYGHLSLQQP